MSVPRSKISWTDWSSGDANFVIRGRASGDCEVSPGCANCYAGAILRRNGMTPEHTTVYPDKLARLRRAKFEPGETPFRRGPGSRPLVFVADMGDLFHAAVPHLFIEEAFDVMGERVDVDWQVLTKRPERMVHFAEHYGWPANVWAGVSVENQAMADERIPLLLQVPARVRFLSMEPLLERVDLRRTCARSLVWTGPHWIIVGGESGAKRRPFDVDWARDVRDVCRRYDLRFFYKQGAGRFPGQDDLLDGRTHKEFPNG